MEEFLKELGIDLPAEKSEDGHLVVDIPDDVIYGKIYSKLERSDLVEEDEESSLLTTENSSITYIGDEYTLTLIADFDQDSYRLTIRPNLED